MEDISYLALVCASEIENEVDQAEFPTNEYPLPLTIPKDYRAQLQLFSPLLLRLTIDFVLPSIISFLVLYL